MNVPKKISARLETVAAVGGGMTDSDMIDIERAEAIVVQVQQLTNEGCYIEGIASDIAPIFAEVRRATVEQIIAMLEDTTHGDWPGLFVMIERIRALAAPAKEPTP